MQACSEAGKKNDDKSCKDSSGPLLNGCWWPTHCIMHACMVCVCIHACVDAGVLMCVCVCVDACAYVWVGDVCGCMFVSGWMELALAHTTSTAKSWTNTLYASTMCRQYSICTDKKILLEGSTIIK